MALQQYEQHPRAIFLMPGGMTNEEFEALCDDVAERGLVYPITLFEGKVLDGWHRYRACHKTGTNLKTMEYTGSDPDGYIMACNVLRRKLTSIQRAVVAAKMHREHGISQRDVCKKAGISNEVLTLVLRAMETKNTRLMSRLENDTDLTRGSLREELTDMGIKIGKEKPEPVQETTRSTNSAGTTTFTLPAHAPIVQRASPFPTVKQEEPVEEDDDLIGGDVPIPSVGKRNSHPERKAKATPAQQLSTAYSELMFDEKKTFIEMVWSDLKPLIVDMGLFAEGSKAKPAAKKAPAKKATKA